VEPAGFVERLIPGPPSGSAIRHPPFARACLLVALACWRVAPAVAQERGPIVDSIIVRTYDVFDDSEAAANALFGVVNAVRFRTRPEIVRRELLFRAGAPYDAVRVAETARNLRAIGIFRDVSIDTTRIEGRLAVVVETRDGWSTQLQLNGRSTGGEFTWSAGLIETNFLGTANVVGAVYRDDPDRTALTLRGRVNRAFGTRSLLDVAYDDRSDGEVGGWVVGVPFRALSDRHAVDLVGVVGRERVLQFRDGVRVDSTERRVSFHRLQGAFAPRAGPDGYVRLSLAAQVKREEYVAYGAGGQNVPDSLSGAFGAAVEWLHPRFTVLTHYNGFAREEDVDLSTRVRVTAWVAPSGLGYARSGVGPQIEARAGVALGRSFLRARLEANQLFLSDRLDSARVRGSVTLAVLPIGRQATVLHLQAEARRGLPPGSEIDLGHGLGPRAFRSHAFTGTRGAWGTLEHRWFAWDELLGVIGVGVAGFLDYGGAWYGDQPRRLGGDVGLGLMIGATRASGTNVGRVDVAYRFGDGWTGNRWIVSVGRSLAY